MKFNKVIIVLSIVCGSIVHACRIEVVNDTDISILVEDAPHKTYKVEAGASQVVGAKHRRPTMIISMQVDADSSTYKKQFTVKQIACGDGMAEPIELKLTDIMNGTYDTTLFERTEFANIHKKLKPSSHHTHKQS